MATWKRLSSSPLTTESQVSVYNADQPELEGFVSVRRAGPGHNARFYGPVVTVEYEFNPDGSVKDERRTVLDASPTFA